MDQLPIGVWAALAGLGTGLALGLAARLGDFCTLGALESAIFGGDQRRLRLWGVVLGTAILATQLLALAGAVNLSATYYHSLVWSPLASVLGGVAFGYGMSMAGHCGFGALARLGGGDIRALLIVVTMGITGFMTLAGPLSPLRIWLFPQYDATEPQGILADLGDFGLPALPVILLISLGAFFWALSYGPLRKARRMVFWGVVAGLAVAFAFWATSQLAWVSLDAVPIEGPSFTAPLGRTLLFLMASTSGSLNFSTGLVFGVVVGGLIGARTRGLFRWEACEDPRELGRQLSGAALMGVGGVVAIGCSVGQGVSAVAALAWSGPVTLMAISFGAWLGLRRLIGGDRGV